MVYTSADSASEKLRQNLASKNLANHSFIYFAFKSFVA
jgi:hypothetical protein